MSFFTPDVIERLEQFARDLDARADLLEGRARDLRGAVRAMRNFATDMREVVYDREVLQAAMPANDNALVADEMT